MTIPNKLHSYQGAINDQADQKKYWCVSGVIGEFFELQSKHNTWFASTLLLDRDNKESTNILAVAAGSMNSPTRDVLNDSLVQQAGLDYVCKILYLDHVRVFQENFHLS